MPNLNKIAYPYMPKDREIKYVPENNPFMLEAKRFSLQNSTDLNHPTGAVMVKDGRTLGYGANHSIFKNKQFVALHGRGFCVRKWFKIKSGSKYWLCPGCVKSHNHAEASAVRDAIGKHGIDTVRGADMYLWGHWWCCKPCWDRMIESSIRDIYLMEKSEVIFK